MVHIYILFQKGAKRNNRNISYKRRKVCVYVEGGGVLRNIFRAYMWNVSENNKIINKIY